MKNDIETAQQYIKNLDEVMADGSWRKSDLDIANAMVGYANSVIAVPTVPIDSCVLDILRRLHRHYITESRISPASKEIAAGFDEVMSRIDPDFKKASAS